MELVQIVNFTTWSRLVGPLLRSSILDLTYLKDPTVIKDLKSSSIFLLTKMVQLRPFFSAEKSLRLDYLKKKKKIS